MASSVSSSLLHLHQVSYAAVLSLFCFIQVSFDAISGLFFVRIRSLLLTGFHGLSRAVGSIGENDRCQCAAQACVAYVHSQ